MPRPVEGRRRVRSHARTHAHTHTHTHTRGGIAARRRVRTVRARELLERAARDPPLGRPWRPPRPGAPPAPHAPPRPAPRASKAARGPAGPSRVRVRPSHLGTGRATRCAGGVRVGRSLALSESCFSGPSSIRFRPSRPDSDPVSGPHPSRPVRGSDQVMRDGAGLFRVATLIRVGPGPGTVRAIQLFVYV